jgi:hypothetical protein
MGFTVVDERIVAINAPVDPDRTPSPILAASPVSRATAGKIDHLAGARSWSPSHFHFAR